MKGSDINSITLKVRMMYCNEGIIPTKEAVSDESVTVRGRRDGIYKCDGMWFRATTTASTKVESDREKIRTRLRITVSDTWNTRRSKSYTTWVTLGMPQEMGVSHAAVMNCVKDFKLNYTI